MQCLLWLKQAVHRYSDSKFPPHHHTNAPHRRYELDHIFTSERSFVGNPKCKSKLSEVSYGALNVNAKEESGVEHLGSSPHRRCELDHIFTSERSFIGNPKCESKLSEVSHGALNAKEESGVEHLGSSPHRRCELDHIFTSERSFVGNPKCKSKLSEVTYGALNVNGKEESGVEHLGSSPHRRCELDHIFNSERSFVGKPKCESKLSEVTYGALNVNGKEESGVEHLGSSPHRRCELDHIFNSKRSFVGKPKCESKLSEVSHGALNAKEESGVEHLGSSPHRRCELDHIFTSERSFIGNPKCESKLSEVSYGALKAKEESGVEHLGSSPHRRYELDHIFTSEGSFVENPKCESKLRDVSYGAPNAKEESGVKHLDSNFLERLIFLGEWYQEEASMARSFYIYFYPADSTIEIFDQKTKKTFLRRTKIDSLSESDFFIGAKLNLLGRQIDILDFGDTLTRNKLANSRKKTFLLLKPDAIYIMGYLMDLLLKNKFNFNNGRMVMLTPDDVKFFFCRNGENETELPILLKQLTSALVVVFELVADDALERLKAVDFSDIPIVQLKRENNTAHSLTSNSEVKNLIYFTEKEENVYEELQYFFGSNKHPRPTAVLRNSTLALIKPHAVKEGKAGKIISDIMSEGFQITAFKMVTLERSNCEEFYEVYRGVLSEYMQMVAQLGSSVCIAMEITCKDLNKYAQEEFRKLCGPMDPEIAVQLRPHTLRAKYGRNKVSNAVHCTDLPEDALLEVEYFFKILD